MKVRFQAAMVVGLAVALAAGVARAREVNLVDGFDTYVTCISATQLGAGADYPGAWEYIYDVYGGSQAWTRWISLRGFDVSTSLNLRPDGWNITSPTSQYLWQRWDAHSITGYVFWGGDQWRDYSPSTWNSGTSSWDLTGAPDAMVNQWHSGGDYYVHSWGFPMYGVAAVYGDGTADERIEFDGYAIATGFTGLLMTMRIVHANEPGTIYFTTYKNFGYGADEEVYGYIVGPSSGGGIEGDYDGDGEVNAADIDILCDNMGSLDPLYDLDNGTGTGTPDGVVDEDDMIYHVETLVELQDGSGRVGSKRGDFNLDGYVDGTDLALMKLAFGQPGQNYADGNANCDLLVDGTDLAILKSNMGFIAPTGGGVPEPVTIGLLSLGGLALLRRRRR